MKPHRQQTMCILTLVVDDEPLARRNLTLLLRGDPDVGEIIECGSGEQAVQAIRHRKPDLVFLDVQMPECGGFDILEQLDTDVPPAIIFVTAYDRYAIHALEAGAVGYLLKPFNDAQFERALARAKGNITRSAPLPGSRAKLAIRSPGRLLLLDIAQIDWIEAADYCACLHSGGATHILRRTLTELERNLSDDAFIRIHRSTIINLDRVRGLELQNAGEYDVVLECGARLRVSRRYRKRLYERLGLKIARFEDINSRIAHPLDADM
jgi:two-component system LytT family response regulator